MAVSKAVPLKPIALTPSLSPTAVALPAVLLLGLGVRLWVVWTQTYIVCPDEIFQYLEQGHRLAFGSGVVPWEFQDGDRSWLLPGVIGALMRICNLFSHDPVVYLRLIRSLCAALSLIVPFVGFRLGQRQAGVLGGILVGGLCAIWFDLIYFAPAVLNEVLAAHCAILAIFLSLQDDATTPRGLSTIGALCGLVFCLRYQYAPALLAVGLWQFRLAWPSWRWLLVGFLAVVLALAGVLDWLTWGSPFQSIWLNFARNSIDGVSSGMGVEPAGFYLGYFRVALQPLPILAVLAIIGAVRTPALGLAAVATLLEHTLVPHKEVRFVYLTIAAAPILIGLGLTELVGQLGRRLDRRFATACAAASMLAGACLSWRTATVTLAPRWQFARSYMLVSLEAERDPHLCGLAVRGLWFWLAGNYTYLNRDVPIWFTEADREPGQPLPGYPDKLQTLVKRDGRLIPPVARLGAETAHFSHMVAVRGDAEPGYSAVVCVTDATSLPGEPDICLYRRPGGCS